MRQHEQADLINALTSVSKVLAGNPELTLRTSNMEVVNPLDIDSEIKIVPDNDNKAYMRGQADLQALIMRHHNEAMHLNKRPINAKAAELYDSLEQIRIEALGACELRGVRDNLYVRMVKEYSHFEKAELIPLCDIISLMARQALTGDKIPQILQRHVANWQSWADSKGNKLLSELAKSIHSQEQFSGVAKKLLKNLKLIT